MPATVHLDRGEGPGVVLLHGVGAGPATFTTVADVLALDHRVLVIERPAGACSLEVQADAVAALLEASDVAPPVVVGVSGGATLALVLAIRHPSTVAALVVHEPLVGHHAPELQAQFAVAASRARTGEAEALAVVRAVMGTHTWVALDASTQADVAAGAERWQAEIPEFAAFDPSGDDLRSLRSLPVLTTVGGRSGEVRFAAARALVRLADAEVRVVPGAGNAVQIDAPDVFAGLVRSWLTVPVGERP